jgi:hypothetical protein
LATLASPSSKAGARSSARNLALSMIATPEVFSLRLANGGGLTESRPTLALPVLYYRNVAATRSEITGTERSWRRWDMDGKCLCNFTKPALAIPPAIPASAAGKM